ncbi:hypothetical protein Tco_1057180 [Tanacetum coccineum]|uniref:Uncharacterized protein n=1 Tax=Tanacetum coccineum TaxID=301880 RepID=A0ABQ5H6Q9_9ASTR
MSPRSLKRVLETLRTVQKSIQDMGFGYFVDGNFDFYYTPSKLGILGNKDGTVNERIIPFLTNTDDVSQMDWCSYALESLVRGCKEYKQGKYFSGPLLLMAIIYVNSTVSEIVKVEKTVPAFMSWNSNLMLKREQEEIELGGFGRLLIVEGLQVIETKNLIENRSVTEDVLDKNEDFKSLNFEEMKDILSQNLVKCNKLMVDTDSKLKIALSLNPKDKELKKMIEERNNLFLNYYKEEDNNGNVKGEEIDGDKNGNTNKTECDTYLEEWEGNKDECEEDKGNKEQQETDRKSNEDEIQNEAEHNESDNIDNIGNLSLSAVQNTTINPPVESTVIATVESTDNVVDLLPQICVDAQKDKNLYAKETENIEKQQKEKNVVQPKGIKIFQPLSKEEKKFVEYIWSDNCPEGDIVFAKKGLELECLWFLSLYLEIKVAAHVIDAWSDVLNHEDKYRANHSITSHVYYWTEMLIDSFINYLERQKHPQVFAFVNANPKQVPMTWKTTNHCMDSGVFVMRHMETYLGRDVFWQEFKKEDAGKKTTLNPSCKVLGKDFTPQF